MQAQQDPDQAAANEHSSPAGAHRWLAWIRRAVHWALRRARFSTDDRTRPQSDLQISVNLDESFGRIEDEDKD